MSEQLSRRARACAAAALVFSGLLVPIGASAKSSGDDAARVLLLEQQAGLLSRSVEDLSGALGFLPQRDIGVSGSQIPDEQPIVVAQSRDAAQLAVRIDQLEQQIRVLTGQVEGLQFQMTQLQTLLERMQEDNDARFSALEGGSGLGKTEAAPLSGGTLPSDGASQALDLESPDSTGTGDTFGLDGQSGLGGQGADIVIDPDAEGFTLGAPEQPLGTLSLDDFNIDNPDGPLDLGGGGGGSMISDADADAQYRAGYDAVVSGDYAFAEDQFRQFIALFPDHPQAPDATNWLGEALIQRGDYNEAAEILLTGFQSYPNAARAPDMLLKLGIALNGAGEAGAACQTFGEVLRRYPTVSPAFKARLNDEVVQAGC